MARKKTTVRIDGHDYVLAGEESEEYMHEVAIYVDRKMSEIHKQFKHLSTSMVAVLSAINIADELLKEKRGTPIVKQQKPTVEKATQQAPVRENIARFNRT